MGRIGGEVVVGSITKEQYDYWVNKNDDEIYQHFLEDDIEESEVPSDAWIGNRWFEIIMTPDTEVTVVNVCYSYHFLQ